MNLYELTIEGAEINRILTENEGELSPELEARMDELLTAGPDKLEAAAMVVRQLEASRDACADEAERLAKRAKSFDANIDSLKLRMLYAVDAAFSGKLKTDKFTIYGQSSPDRVSFEVAPDADLKSISDFAPELVRAKYELNKTALAERYKRGDILPNAITPVTVPGKRSIRIK